MSTFRKLLLSLLLVSLTGSAFGAGTFASFTASTTNAASTFSTGTIVLTNTVGGDAGTTCFSTSAGLAPNPANFTNDNTNSTCEAIFPAALKQPGDDAVADINLENAGNLDSELSFSFQGTGLAGICETDDDVTGGNAYHGDGDLCPTLLVNIQQFDTDARDTLTGDYQCIYDSTSGNNGALSACDNLATLSDIEATAGTPLVIGPLDAGETRYLRLTYTLPSGAGNDMMGRKVDFSLVWALAQV